MQSTTRNWDEFSQNLAIVASMANDFLELSEDEKSAIFEKRDSDLLSAYAGVHLAATIRQAKDMVRLLEVAESAWKEARKKAGKGGKSTKDRDNFMPSD